MSDAHTPGPWIANPSNLERYSQYILPRDYKAWPYDVVAYIPEAYGDKCTFPGSHMANARLIAAAPDLLQELRNIANADTAEWDDRSEFEAWAKNRARFAIAKAVKP